jgi:hypothetical protein
MSTRPPPSPAHPTASTAPVPIAGARVDPDKPRLLPRVRAAIRVRHYSPRTEQAYVYWIKRYIFYHGVRHPVQGACPSSSPTTR